MKNERLTEIIPLVEMPPVRTRI